MHADLQARDTAVGRHRAAGSGCQAGRMAVRCGLQGLARGLAHGHHEGDARAAALPVHVAQLVARRRATTLSTSGTLTTATAVATSSTLHAVHPRRSAQAVDGVRERRQDHVAVAPLGTEPAKFVLCAGAPEREPDAQVRGPAICSSRLLDTVFRGPEKCRGTSFGSE